MGETEREAEIRQGNREKKRFEDGRNRDIEEKEQVRDVEIEQGKEGRRNGQKRAVR